MSRFENRRTPAAALLAAAIVSLSACADVITGPPQGSLEVVVSGLDSPVYLTAPEGDAERLFVVEQSGRILIVRDGVVLPDPFLDIRGPVGSGGERGLLSMAFHPDYAQNGRFFVNYTDNGGTTRVARYTVSADPDEADAGSATDVISVSQPFENHNGGQLQFGADGLLYIAMGDGGSGGDPQMHGQSLSTLLGAMLRIDVDGGSPYAIPVDNPYRSHPIGLPEIWAIGFRNPWRFSFDRLTGDLYVGDVGQGSLEEISFQAAGTPGGRNFGWNTMEGTDCFSPSSGCDTSGLTLPIHDYPTSDGCAVTGGFVYRGSANPTLQGRYFFSDFCARWVRSFRVESGSATDLIDHEADFGPVSQVVSFGEDGVGELYLVGLGGTIWRLGTP